MQIGKASFSNTRPTGLSVSVIWEHDFPELKAPDWMAISVTQILDNLGFARLDSKYPWYTNIQMPVARPCKTQTAWQMDTV